MTTAEAASPTPASSAPYPMHSGIDTDRYFRLHLLGAAFPVAAGVLFYGWRAALLIGVVLVFTALATYLWQRIGKRGQQLHYFHILYLALLLALTLPPHLASFTPQGSSDLILGLILPGTAFALVIFTWLLGGIGSGRVHPILVTHLLLVCTFAPLLVPHTILHRTRLILGDVTDAEISELVLVEQQSWIDRPPQQRHDAIYCPVIASEHLIAFTTRPLPERAWMSLESLLRDRLPPLEDLIFATHPAPIAHASALAIIIGGLFLLYRGLIDVSIPLLIVLTMFAAILVLPIPVAITDATRQWRWLAFREPNVGWSTAITFANYQLFASPMLFMAFFLATLPAIRPLSRRGRIIYAILVGLATAPMQLYVSVSAGPYVALLLVSLLTPLLDHLFKPRPLV